MRAFKRFEKMISVQYGSAHMEATCERNAKEESTVLNTPVTHAVLMWRVVTFPGTSRSGYSIRFKRTLRRTDPLLALNVL